MKYTNKDKMMKEFASKHYKVFYDLFDSVMKATTYIPAQTNETAQSTLESLREQEWIVRDTIREFVKKNGKLNKEATI